MKDAIIEIIKWIRESIRPVVVILALAAIVLFIPHSWATSVGLGDGFSKYRFIAFLCFVGSIVWLVSFPVEQRYFGRKKIQYLGSLTEEERNILRPFILNSKKTQSFAMGAPVARHLVSLKILTETVDKDVRGHSVFVIDAAVCKHLTHNPKLVGAVRNSN
jgi:hypothetical protein